MRDPSPDDSSVHSSFAPVSSSGEESLILVAASGDLAAFGDIYLTYRDRIYGFICRMTHDSQLAEDLTHDVFLALLQHPEKYDPAKGSVLTFLCAVARCRLVDRIRRNGTRGEIALWSDENENSWSENESRYTPFEDLLGIELKDLVAKAIQTLPPLQREVLLLRVYEGLSYEEIAAAVGNSVGVIKARLYRARQFLVTRLGPKLTGNGD